MYHVLLDFLENSETVVRFQPLATFNRNDFLNNHDAVVDFIVNSPKPMHSLDERGYVIWANKEILANLGYTEDEYVGHPVSEFLVSQDMDEYKTNLQNCIDKGSLNEREILVRKKDGTVRHFIISATVRHLDDGKVYTRTILRDDTERLIRIQAEQAEREHKVVRTLLDLKRAFVRFVSHETRSPLGVAHGGVELLLSHPHILAAPGELKELVEDVYVSINSAIQILSDLLQYESIDAGTFTLEKSRQVVGSWSMADNLRSLKSFAKGRSISFSVTHNFNESLLVRLGEGAMPMMLPIARMVLDIDRIRIEQVVRNLVSNAIKFTKQDGCIKVSFSAVSLDKDADKAATTTIAGDFTGAIAKLRVEIVDSGAGIDWESQKRIFSQFAQFNRNELQGGGGSGLGLWISRHIIDLHKGVVITYLATPYRL